MKKIALVLISLIFLATAAFGIFFAYTYKTTTAKIVPDISISAMGQTCAPSEYEWSVPILNGITYKTFKNINAASNAQLLPQTPPSLQLEVPNGMQAKLTLTKNDALVFNDDILKFNDELIQDAGNYAGVIVCAMPKNAQTAFGNFTFFIEFNIPEPEPKPTTSLSVGNLNLQQGDIFSLKINNLAEGIKPSAETSLGFSVFTPNDDGSWYCAIPVGNTMPAGEYLVKITAGDIYVEKTVTVSVFDFDEQNLIIDTSSPNISEANSPKAYEEYRQKIPPFFATFDEARYWESAFLMPVQGRISTKFGEIRYTNGDYSNPRSHYGMDIAAGEGTPVQVPASGKVVLAEYLLNTGNTVVIEHGGGLKSYYFHLSKLSLEKDQMVNAGDALGEIGTTGYSTGPHLHFEMRIGKAAINPAMLFDENAGLYSANNAASEEIK